MTAQGIAHPLPGVRQVARPTFRGAFRGELIKLRHNRPTLVMSGLGLLFLALFMLLFATEPQYQQYLLTDPRKGFYQILHPLALFFAAGGGITLLLTGSRLLGMEYDLGTVRVLYARGTGRRQLLAAKIMALSLLALVLLIGFVVLSAIGVVLVVQHQTGSLGALEALPAGVWENTGLAILACAISEFSCVLLAVTMPALLRSVTSGMVLALLFFPVDNGLAIALARLTSLTHSRLWGDATAYLLGPTLNHLPTLLQIHPASAASTLTTPSVRVSLAETLVVIVAWWVLLLVIAIASLTRNDVLN